MTGLRVAFLTVEYPTETTGSGGLASYLDRMTRALREEGHEPEVFVISAAPAGRIEHEGVLVHRVHAAHDAPTLRLARAVCQLTRLRRGGALAEDLAGPMALGAALERRDRERPFDLVQSADYLAPGLFVKRRPGRPHVVRASWAAGLFRDVDGRSQQARERIRARLELATLRRADAAYAPSRLVSDYFRREHGLLLPVVRPPVALDARPADRVRWELPERYFVHFGRIGRRKGTEWLLQAARVAWAAEPALRLVLAGPGSREAAENARDVRMVGLGSLPKPELYHVLQRAEAAVLPSLVDNLPNTVIESLMLGVPVIGTAGASIDELVEPGVTGALIPLGDFQTLAATLVEYWRAPPISRGFEWRSAVRTEMEPRLAVARLLQVAGLPAPPRARPVAATEDARPLISVIIPCYNQGRFLAQAIDSVLAQEYPHHEVIVVDDGSIDDTPRIAAGYADRIRYLHQENAGLSEARNRGLRAAGGDLIQFLDSDDWLDAGMHARIVEAARAHPAADLFHGEWHNVGPDGSFLARHGGAPLGADPVAALLAGNRFPAHCVVLRRELAQRVGEFKPELRACEDWDYWLRAAAAGAAFQAVPGAVGFYRRSSGSMSSDYSRMWRAGQQVLGDARGLAARSPAWRAASREGRRRWREYCFKRLWRGMRAMDWPARLQAAVEAGRDDPLVLTLLATRIIQRSRRGSE